MRLVMMVATATVAVIGNGMGSTTPDGSPLTANGRVMQTRREGNRRR